MTVKAATAAPRETLYVDNCRSSSLKARSPSFSASSGSASRISVTSGT